MGKLKIGVIVSSTRPTRIGRKLADWFMGQVAGAPDLAFELIDLAEVNLPFLNEPKSPMMGDYQHEHTKQWSEKVKAYDGYVFVTAEYNHGYPAPLKNALDSAFHEWARKPVAFFGYGSLGATRAIEQLINVTARLDMAPLSMGTLHVLDVRSALDEQGKPKPEHLHGDLQRMLDQLTWWGRALKTARTAATS
jgi:NAD(P)H-dependent FMN reductase